MRIHVHILPHFGGMDAGRDYRANADKRLVATGAVSSPEE